MTSRPPLAKGELEIARAVWELGEASVGQVYQHVTRSRDLDYSTVQTYMRRLEAKGYLRTRREGRNKIYSARVQASQVIKETVDDIKTRLFDGQALPMMLHLVRDEGINQSDLQQLRDVLAELEDGDDDADDA